MAHRVAVFGTRANAGTKPKEVALSADHSLAAADSGTTLVATAAPDDHGRLRVVTLPQPQPGVQFRFVAAERSMEIEDAAGNQVTHLAVGDVATVEVFESVAGWFVVLSQGMLVASQQQPKVEPAPVVADDETEPDYQDDDEDADVR